MHQNHKGFLAALDIEILFQIHFPFLLGSLLDICKLSIKKEL